MYFLNCLIFQADHEMNGVDEYTKDDLTDKVTNLERENRKLKKMLKKSYDIPKDPWKEEDLGELEEEQLNLPLDLDYDMDNGAQVCKTHEPYEFSQKNSHFLIN